MIDFGKNSNVEVYLLDHGSHSHILEQPLQISFIFIKGFMVDSSIHFKVVPTKSVPLLTMIQLGNDAWVLNSQNSCKFLICELLVV